MIFIVDSGATKADWIAVDASGRKLFSTQTLGLNPEVITRETINERLINNKELEISKTRVSKVFFYGAGCGTERVQQLMQKILSKHFLKAEIQVKEDTYAAVFATVGKSKAIVSIIGTGSNCSLWDGKNVIQKVHSLGYSIMDDCSGNYFGKQLIRAYYFNTMPKYLALKLSKDYDMSPDTIKNNLYKEPNPNKYLATFAQFMIENKKHTFFKKFISEGFYSFYQNYISQFEEHREISSHFVGSIAYYLSDELIETMTSYGVKIGKILKKPINGLFEYHRKNIL